MAIINGKEELKSWSVTPSGITVVGRVKEYDTYADMLADESPGVYALVTDASGDPTVNKGTAAYKNEHGKWRKIYEEESMDQPTLSEDVINQIISQNKKDDDYTAFWVYADDTDDHTQVYPRHNSYPQFLPSYIRFAGENTSDPNQVPTRLYNLYQSNPNPTEAEIIDALSYSAADIYKSQTERFVIWADADYTKSNIVVDWGDGTQSKLANGKTQTDRGNGFYDNDEYSINSDDKLIEFMFSHRYEAEGKYLVKITGTGYFAIRHYYNGLKNADGSQKYPEAINVAAPKYNLVYETMGPDTPIASCVNNLSSFMIWNKRLLHVYLPYANIGILRTVSNWSNAFGYCTNLVSSRGLYFNGYGLTGNQTVGSLHNTNSSLEIFVGSLPAATSSAGWNNCFLDCMNLKADIASIIPKCGILGHKFDVSNAFRNCLKLYGTVPANLLWADTNVNWLNTGSTFGVTNAAYNMPIRSQVPANWGGTKSE